MKKPISEIIKSIACKLLILYPGLIFFQPLYSQLHPLPVLPDTSMLGQYTSRTINLLQQSTPLKRNTVRILVYGQSISAQDWWYEVKRTIESRFPYADLIMENKSIGGFSTQYLYKTVEMDVSSFYPDLVLLHVYGNNHYYDSVLYTIRSRTAAEVAIMTDHYIGENAWSDTMCYHILPTLAEKYKCEIINIRDPWKKYLKDNHLEISSLLTDGTHLNDYGNFLMAELVKPLFCFKSHFESDPYDLQTTCNNKNDLTFLGDTLTVHFYGNKVDLLFDNSVISSGDSVEVLLDGKVPSSYQGTYYMTRPFNDKGKGWPWNLPAMIRIRHTQPWVTELWSCIFTKARTPYLDFRFRIQGSVSGQDGKGSGSRDFISKSGKVIISKNDAEKGGDWHLNRSYKVLKTIVNDGDTIKWKTYSISKDVFVPVRNSDTTLESSITLFQGIPNTEHTLKLVKKGRQSPPVSGIKVYRPFMNK
jgi:hypothetical protein